MKYIIAVLAGGLLLAASAWRASGADAPPPPPGNRVALSILLDRPYKAGELTLFADQADDKAFYYVVDKPHLALDSNGTPQFSFLRWVDNKPPAAGDEKGGGIIHALVELGVSDEQLQQARAEIQALKPGAKIVGPAMFSAGRFGLVASVTDESGKLAKKVLGLGPAPMLDGQKAAVSIRLTELGAKVLWESFKTPTPDISFSFEMELTGLSSPFRAKLEADWEKVYKSQTFQAGFAHTYLGGEINLAFEELRRTGAIKLSQVGTDTAWETKLGSAYETLTNMMFDKGPDGQVANAAMAAGMAGKEEQTGLDRATTLLNNARTTTLAADNMAIDKENMAIKERNMKAKMDHDAEAAAKRKEADAAKKSAMDASDQLKGLMTVAGDKPTDDQKAKIEAKKKEADKLDAAAKEADKVATAKEMEKPKEEKPKDPKSPPTWALVASYKLKKQTNTGHFVIDLNKYSAATVAMRFDANIGDLRRLMNTDHFRQVNLDDPLYQERDVVAYLDGLAAQDFGQYINFVTLQMRKTHQSGDITNAEVRIDRDNFNKQGNQFRMVYGWKGDNDRRRWLDYEYRTVWSFFGGRTIEQAWQRTQNGAIPLAPPFQARTLTVDAAPDFVNTAGVRAITVKVFYDLGAGERTRQITLNTFKNVLSGKVDFILPQDQDDYAYELILQLKGDRTVTSGRRRGSSGVLVVEALPSQ